MDGDGTFGGTTLSEVPHADKERRMRQYKVAPMKAALESFKELCESEVVADVLIATLPA
jgi:hypothetical protein